MDAWSAGRLLVIDVRVNVLCWFRFSPGKTSFSEWHIQGLQSPCPTHNSGFGAGGKRDRKQQCCRAVAGRTGTEPRAFPGWGTSSKPGWGLVFGIGARHRQLGVTWVSRRVLCCGWAASPPDLWAPSSSSTQLSQAPAPRDAFRGKKPLVLSYAGRGQFYQSIGEHVLGSLGSFCNNQCNNVLCDISSVFISKIQK